MRLVKYEHPTKGIWTAFIAVTGLVGLYPFFLYLAVRLDTKHSGPHPALFVFFGIFCLIQVVGLILTLRAQLRLRGHGAFVSDEGVGSLRDGEQAWIVPWSRFGGYRKIRLTRMESIFHSERGGIEILDLDGISIGRLSLARNLNDGGNTSAARERLSARRLILRTIDDRSRRLERGHTEPEPATKRWPKKVAVTVLALSSTLFLASFVTVGYVVQLTYLETPPAWASSAVMGGSFAILIIPILFGAVFALMSAGELHAIRNPKLYERRIIADPAEGPSELEHLLTAQGKPKKTELADGVRYRYVHPEQIEARVASEEVLLKAIPWFCGILGALPFLMMPLMPPERLRDVGFLVGFPAFVLSWMLVIPFARRYYKEKRRRIYDTLIKHDGQLTIVREDGSHLTFSPKAKWRKVMDSSDEIVSENGVRYRLNRTRLFASETPLDHEELLS